MIKSLGQKCRDCGRKTITARKVALMTAEGEIDKEISNEIYTSEEEEDKIEDQDIEEDLNVIEDIL